MTKFLFVGRRAAGRTRAAAQAHLRDVHGRMVVCPPADAGAMPAYYAQNHVVDGAYPAGDGPHAIERDLVTQLDFDSLDAMRAAIETPYYRTMLRPDEPRFVDDATVARLNVLPATIVAGERTRYKLFALAARVAGIDDERWDAARGGLGAMIARQAGLTALIENSVLPPPAGDRFADVVFEAWFADPADAIAAVPPTVAAFDTDAFDRARSIAIVAQEYTQERLRAHVAAGRLPA